MINPAIFYEELSAHGIQFYTGVPDSLLKHFNAYLAQILSSQQHVIAANEGNAIALATGHYLATGHPALVYMQNSGQGNALNPLVSLVIPYRIPMVLLIGWRGEPGTPDEPQHAKQGAITTDLCEVLDIPYQVLPPDETKAKNVLNQTFERVQQSSLPAALIVRKGTFSISPPPTNTHVGLSRENVIEHIVAALPDNAAIVSTTGHISRELYECRIRAKQDAPHDFMMTGSMGHASQIALAIALSLPERLTVCLDGDGATLMHMGGLAITGTSQARNFLHIVLNNGAHGSVGGQKTAALDIDLKQIAASCGYENTTTVDTMEALTDALNNPCEQQGPSFIEIRVNTTARKDLLRPACSPEENKENFMKHLAT